jgi:hypothetical protein
VTLRSNLEQILGDKADVMAVLINESRLDILHLNTTIRTSVWELLMVLIIINSASL